MLFNPAIVLSFLLASAVSAHRPQRRAHHSGLSPVEESSDLAKRSTRTNDRWAGAGVSKGHGTFHHVEGTFTVPHVSGGSGASASAWVGIDGDKCQRALLQTGVDFWPDRNPQAWYEWYPDQAFFYSGISIMPGDKIKVSVTADSATSALTKIVNLSNGQSMEQSLSAPTSSSMLCMQDAEWIVEDWSHNSNLVPFANFGTVTFEGAKAKDRHGRVHGPGGGDIFQIEQNGQVLATASTMGDSVTIHYE